MEKLSKAKWCLLGGLIVILVFIAGSVFIPGSIASAVKWVANSDLAYQIRAPSEQPTNQGYEMVEVVVDSVGISKINYQPVVILKEKEGELHLPIWIGFTEADAISMVLEGVEVPRPLTHDLLGSILNRTGANLDYIVINDLQNDVFYASLMLNANWTQMEIDARPSDAIAIALRMRAPIYVTKAVLEKAGVPSELEAAEYTAGLSYLTSLYWLLQTGFF
jgi:bifunctional DNase/RNase